MGCLEVSWLQDHGDLYHLSINNLKIKISNNASPPKVAYKYAEHDQHKKQNNTTKKNTLNITILTSIFDKIDVNEWVVSFL